MSYEMIALFMFASMMLMLFTGQRVFGAIGAVGAISALALWGTTTLAGGAFSNTYEGESQESSEDVQQIDPQVGFSRGR